MKVVQIPVSMISANPEQPRKVFKDSELEELTESIAEYGVLQPLIVKRAEGRRFVLVAGERRLRAACLAGLKTVPAIVKEIQDREAALIALVENVQRENLNYIEEAEAYCTLLTEHDLTQEELADKLGKGQSTIANKIRILKLSPEIRQILTENSLTERHARALLRLSEEKQRLRVAKLIAERGLNVAKTEELVDKLLRGPERPYPEPKTLRLFKDLRIFTNTIKQAVDMMKRSGIEATAKKRESDDNIEYTIVIPKNTGKPMIKAESVRI